MKTFTNCAEKKAKQILNLLQGYTKGIRITAILILLLMGVSNVWGKTIYLYTDGIGWPDSSAKIWVHAWGSGKDTDVQMTKVKEKLYQADIPDADTKVIFTRTQSTSTGVWDKEWNRVGEQTLNDETPCLKLTDWSTGTWGKISYDAHMYLDNSVANWTEATKEFMIGHSSYSDTYTMTQISNTKLYYLAFSNIWHGYWDYGFIGVTSHWGPYENQNITTRIKSAAKRTGTRGDQVLNGTKLFVPANANNDAVLTKTDLNSYSDLNSQQTIKSAVNGADANSKAPISITSYAMTGNGTATEQTATLGTGAKDSYITAARTATTTLTVGDVATGYQFDGWYAAKTGGTALSTSTTYTYSPTAATTVYARFSTIKYTVTYGVHSSGNGTLAAKVGSTGISSGDKVNDGSEVVFTASPSTGYEIEGWYSNADCTTSLNNGTENTYTIAPLTAEATVYVKFKQRQHTVLFGVHSSGHGSLTAKVGNTSISSGNRVNYGSTIVFTATPSTGYQIEGWYKDSDCTISLDNGTLDTYSVTVTTGTNVHVKFKAKEYTITYKDQNNANFSGTHASGYPTEHTYGTATTLSTATKDGYTFGGWHTDAACDNQVTSLGATAYTSDITLYAKWTANTYTVHFDKNANDAKGSMDDQVFTYGEPKELTKNAFTFDKYSFVGWATTKDGEKAYDDQSKVSNLSSTNGATVTLYAKWEPKATYTVTLDQTGAKTKGTTSVTATLGDPMPTITLPTPADGYAFMGYWDGKDGSGTQYYDAAGKSMREWNQAKNTTLYAYFKKAEITSITLNKDVFESGETGFVIVTSHEVAPTPAGTVVVCWTLCYTNGTPVEGHNAIEENGTVKFAIDGLSAGTYKIVASLRLNNCNGEELDTAEATFVVAGSYTVTIKYTCDGQEIAGRTTIKGHPSRQTEVTAAVIGGYNFVKWELGDGISTTDALTGQTINITANYEGYLTATYEKKKLIFLDLSKKFGKTDWPAPHIYLYSEEFWNENLGTGATDPKCVAKGAMSPVPGTTGMWFYEYEDVNNFNGYVAFTPTDKMSQANFYDTEVIHRGDFSIGTPVFVPAVGQIANIKNPSEGKNAQYYNKGHWTKYMGGTGYTLKIYNHKEAEGRKELMSVPFTGSSLYLPFTAVVDLEAGQTFGYKIVRDNDKWYKNDADGTMTVNSHTNWPFIEDKNNGLACGIQTVAAGIHTFTLTLNATSGNFEVTVDYPVTVGDYRILYKDNTRTTYKPSDIKKAEELNPVTSFFIRPNSNPELKIQTAARIFEEGVTWANSNGIYFRPNSQWKEANARFAAYFYNGSKNEWKDLTQNGDIYSCEKPSGYTHVIFVRLDPAGRGNSTKNNGLHWDYKWTQTINLKLPVGGENFYSLEEDVWRGKIRLKPNSNWKGDNARFAAYFFEKSGDKTTKEVWNSMFKEDENTYWCDIPDGCSKVIFCRMNPDTETNGWDNDGNNMWNQTSDLDIPEDDNDLYTVKENTWDKGGGSWSNKYTVWSKITGTITDLTEELKKKLGEINGDIGKAPDSVYTIHLEKNGDKFSVAKVVPYTGNFYIRVDAAAGKWYDYKTNPDNLMTYSAFSESDANSFGEKFSHYKTEWCSDGMNVKFVIANDYSPCISDTLVQDEGNPFNNINENGNLTNEYNYNANIRFMWNRSTNKVSRAYVASATNPDLKFLVLKTNENIQDKDGKEVKEVIFQDTQNWIYEYTIKAKPGTRVKLYACYPTDDESKAQHFRGAYDNPATFGESNSVQILGGTGEAWNTIRVLYDFKTNRLMGAWVPESAISTEQAIAADLMVIRRHQEDATCVTLTNENSKLTDVKTAYGAMQFNRWTINNRGGADDLDVTHCTKLSGSHRVYDETITNEYHPVLPLAEQKSIYERGLYFISFPFDVHLSDVFGFGTYGTHWVISTYNGKRRAERGYFAEDCINEDCTNWDYIWDPSGFVMKANEGYLLSLDLDLMKHDNTDFWANNIGQVELFFPSTAAVKSIEKTDYTMPPLGEEYLCKINHNTQDGDRRVKDSYWRCIGVPSFADYDGSLTTDGTSPIEWKADYTWEPDNGAFPFLYEWNVTNNDLVVRSTNSYKFRATYAYLIQNGNEIHWKAVNTNKPASIIARDQTENVSNYEWKIALLRNDAPADHTFIRMTDNESVTSAFDFHQDLSKEFNYGANIYTLVGYERLAANSLPMSDSTTIIPLGVSAQEAGDYTITMPEGVESIGITLVDNETGIHTNLSAGQEYTLTLNNGICENRLFIEVSPIQNTPTDLEYTTEDTREQTTRKMLIDGILYLIRDGVIYDAQGHRL